MSRPHITVEQAVLKEIPKNSKILIAVSGGIDSVSLLHACYKAHSQLHTNFEVIHVDHGLRAESAKDLEFVKELSENYGFRFFSKKLTPPKEGVNIEAWGRKERYGFFKEVLEHENFEYILTAHNANDVAETFLMRLVSNKELTSILKFDPERRILRPLLKVSRESIENYAKENKLQFVEDHTNEDTNFLRNRVRHVLLPLLKNEFDENITETLALRAEAIAEDISFLNSIFEPVVKKLASLEFGSVNWMKEAKEFLKSTNEKVRWRLIALLIRPKVGFMLSRSKAIEVGRVILGEQLGTELPGGIYVSSLNRGSDSGLKLHEKSQIK